MNGQVEDRSIVADADHPALLTYGELNTLEASKGQKVYMSLSDEEGYLPLDVMSFGVYEEGSTEKVKDATYSINGDTPGAPSGRGFGGVCVCACHGFRAAGKSGPTQSASTWIFSTFLWRS